MKVTINRKEIDSIIPMNTIFQLTKGLMFKKKGRALLIFPNSARHSIWMAFMKYPLDLIFIDETFKIIDITENVLPLTFNPKTWKTYFPKEKCRYILEVESGIVKSTGLMIGAVAEFKI
ncbi:MAG: hypothetical protein DRN66_02120 [Candidatus Nanohalarchaeota archaeon]|nr:MAG: hypothetical protein DRN66_02120 [Candidatus Nanohaloarchaeota archaeon]